MISVYPLRQVLLLFLLVVASTYSARAQEQSVSQTARIFVQAWNADYKPTECGDNIGRLLKRLESHGIDLSHARVLVILPVYDGLLVNAERARIAKVGVTTEVNWYHHVILELDGQILDFDFMDRPTVVPVAKYFNEMFFNEINPPFYPHLLVGLAEKLKYKVEIYQASDYLKSGAKSPIARTNLGKYVKDFDR